MPSRIVSGGNRNFACAVVIVRFRQLLGKVGHDDLLVGHGEKVDDDRGNKHRTNRSVSADAGGQHGELLVVPLHPGYREDRRHHPDHTAELVEELTLVDEIITAHDLVISTMPSARLVNSSRFEKASMTM